MSSQNEQLARNYMNQVILQSDANSDAFDEFIRVLGADPRAAWDVVLRLIALANTDHDLASIGCGPLEEVLLHSPDEFIPRAVAEAIRNTGLRKAMRYVTIADNEVSEHHAQLLRSLQ
jgi:hypothetical protein